MIVSASRLTVMLERVTALRDVSFTFDRGQWVGLLGPNGAGKTTLLRSLGGLVNYSGRLVLDGVDVRDWDRRDLAKTLAFVRQSVSLAFDFRVEDLVLLGRSPHKNWHAVFNREDRRLAAQALDSVDLSDFSSRSIHSLSSGERQRVFLAQALAQQPDLLLLDEPTAHLDIHHRFAFLGHVREYVESGRTVIAAFHDLELAAQFADRIIILQRGEAAATGTPEAVLTADVIARVFRVDATISQDGGHITGIRYHGNLPAHVTGPASERATGPHTHQSPT